MSEDAVLGLSIASGVLYYGAASAVTDADTGEVRALHVAGAPERLQLSTSLDGAEQLGDFKRRFQQDLRSLRPTSVGLVATRSYSGWVYKQAFARIGLASAVMLACDEASIPFTELKTEAIGKAVRLPAMRLETLHHEVVGFASKPSYWGVGRAEAFAAALTLLS